MTLPVTPISANLSLGGPAQTGWFNVKEYGAVGNGVADDTAAIKATITAAAAGAAVYFPSGTYLVTPTAFVGFSTTSANLTFMGAGASSIIKFVASATAASYIMYVNSANVTVQQLQFDSNGVSQAQLIRVATGGSKLRVTNCLFTNPKTGGVYIEGAPTDVNISNNVFNGGGYGVLVKDDSTVTRLVIANNQFIGDGTTASDGIQVNTPSGGAVDVVVTGNTVTNYPTSGANGMGIGFANVQRGSITGNTVSSCGLDGIHLEDRTSNVSVRGNVVASCGRSGITFASSSATMRGISIVSNVIKTCGTVSGSGGIASDFTATPNTKEWVVADNIVQGCGVGSEYYGIDINDARNGVISGNVVTDTQGTTTAGIRIIAGVNVKIANNRCYDQQGVKTQDYGIKLQGNMTDVQVFGNDVTGNGTGGVDKASIGTVSNLTESQNTAQNALNGNRKDLAYSASIATDASLGQIFVITVTNGTAFTIQTPTKLTDGQVFTYMIYNNSGGGMGAITWGGIFLLAGAFTNPANTKRRTITFWYDGTLGAAFEISRAAADI